MNKKTITLAVVTSTAVLSISAPGAALAHITVTPDKAPAASYAALEFSVGHGCDGSATTAVTFTIPEGIESVTPTVNPGWTISETASAVTYTASTPLPDDRRDTMTLSVLLPEGEAGETLAFPVLQECEVGETNWSELAEGDSEPEHPAPVLALLESSGDAHGHASENTEEMTAATAGETAGAEGGSDVLARIFGIGGLALGAAGLALGLRRRGQGA